jgi:[ribosomal protein S18]-alanine N-acetyltransferase
MTLRAARAGDVSALAAIEAASFSDPWSVRSFERLLSAAHARVTVVELPSGLVAGFTVLLHAADEAELANIAVAAAHRGAGLGRALLAHAIAQASALAATTVFLEVRPSNVAALALYSRAGFLEVGRRRRYYSSPTEDAIVLARAV